MTTAAWFFTPVLAIDLGQIFGLLILLITILSWVVNAIQGAQKSFAEKNARNQRQQGTPQSPSKLEDFLREAGLKLPTENQQDEERARQEEARRRQAAIERRLAKEQQKKNRQQNQPQNRGGGKKGSSGSQQSSGKQQAPQGLGSLTSADPYSRQINAENGYSQTSPGANQAAPAPLQTFQEVAPSTLPAPQPATNLAATQAHPLLKSLLQPQGMAQAILMNEILSKPRALRTPRQN